MLLTICATFLVTIVCVLFGTIVGAKFYDIFGWRWIAIVGPLTALATGIGFGVRHLGLSAGLIAGCIGAVGAAIALFRE